MSARSHKKRVSGFKVYPFAHRLAYNSLTVLHYLLGAAALALGYNNTWLGPALSIVYGVYAFGQMYLLMPLRVCPNCPYTHSAGSLCVSGLSRYARRQPLDAAAFEGRSAGLLCHNNLSQAAQLLPVFGMLPALWLNFSAGLLGVFVGLLALLAVRVFIVLPLLACKNCRARTLCPNARAIRLAGG